MDASRRAKQIAATVTIASILGLTESFVGALGFSLPPQLDLAIDYTRSALLVGSILLIIVASAILFLGFFILSGWQTESKPPLPLRAIAALGLGIASIILSGLLTALIPIPLLPTAVVSVALWAALRYLSSEHSQAASTPESGIASAETAARRHLESQGFPNAKLREGRADEGRWKMVFDSGSEAIEVEVDHERGVNKWRRVLSLDTERSL